MDIFGKALLFLIFAKTDSNFTFSSTQDDYSCLKNDKHSPCLLNIRQDNLKKIYAGFHCPAVM